MPFIDRFCLQGAIRPVRVYAHEKGYMEAYGNMKTGVPDMDEGKEYLLRIINCHHGMFEGSNFMIAFLYGEQCRRSIRFFLYKGLSPWSEDPEVGIVVIKDGRIIPNEAKYESEDFLTVLSAEGSHRRKKADIGDYMKDFPRLRSGTMKRTRTKKPDAETKVVG